MKPKSQDKNHQDRVSTIIVEGETKALNDFQNNLGLEVKKGSPLSISFKSKAVSTLIEAASTLKEITIKRAKDSRPIFPKYDELFEFLDDVAANRDLDKKHEDHFHSALRGHTCWMCHHKCLELSFRDAANDRKLTKEDFYSPDQGNQEFLAEHLLCFAYMRKEVDNLKTQHLNEINNLKAAHSQEIKDLNTRHSINMKEIITTYETNMQNMKGNDNISRKTFGTVEEEERSVGLYNFSSRPIEETSEDRRKRLFDDLPSFADDDDFDFLTKHFKPVAFMGTERSQNQGRSIHNTRILTLKSDLEELERKGLLGTDHGARPCSSWTEFVEVYTLAIELHDQEVRQEITNMMEAIVKFEQELKKAVSTGSITSVRLLGLCSRIIDVIGKSGIDRKHFRLAFKKLVEYSNNIVNTKRRSRQAMTISDLELWEETRNLLFEKMNERSLAIEQDREETVELLSY